MSKVFKFSENSEKCPKCKQPMERRIHLVPPKKKKFYFSEWDYCPACRHVQHYERYKVVLQPKNRVMSQMGEEKPKPESPFAKGAERMFQSFCIALLPGIRYAVNRLRDRGDSSQQVAALEWDIARIEDGKIPAFLEQDGRKVGA